MVSQQPFRQVSYALAVSVGAAPISGAMEPSNREQIESYRLDGSFAERAAAARAIGNHLISPHLMNRLDPDSSLEAGSEAEAKSLPCLGRQRVFALLVGFSNYPGRNPANEINRRLFRTGPDS